MDTRATPTYLYRCTEQQLESHLQRIAEEGDAVEHVIYKGGRDYVLVCRKAGDQDPVAAVLHAILAKITEAVDALPQAVGAAVNGAAARAVRS